MQPAGHSARFRMLSSQFSWDALFEGTFEGTVTSQLVVDGPAIHNFGECRQGETLTHDFYLRNTGEHAIEVVELRSSCSCAVPGGKSGFSDKSIAPGKTVPLPVRFALSNKQDTATARVLVFYESDQSEDRQVLDLRLTANVLPDYRFTPKRIEFGTVGGLASRTTSRTIRVWPVAMQELTKVSASVESEHFSVEISPLGDDGSYVITVTADTTSFSANQLANGSLLLETDSVRVPRSVIPIALTYIAPVSVEPSAVVIGSDKTGELNTSVNISSRCMSRLVRVSASDPRIRVSFDDQQITREHETRLVAPPVENQSLSAQIEFQIELLPKSQASVLETIRLPFFRFPTTSSGEKS